MVKNMLAAFEEDVVGLAMQEEMQRQAGDELYEVSFGSDALTIAMRRYLKSRVDAEKQVESPGAVDEKDARYRDRCGV